MTVPETVQNAEAKLRCARAALATATRVVKSEEENVARAEEAVEKAKKEQDEANKTGQRFLQFCHGGESQRHEFVLLQMKDESSPGHYEQRLVGYERDYSHYPDYYYDDCNKRPIYDEVFVAGKRNVHGTLECKHCGAKVEMTNL